MRERCDARTAAAVMLCALAACATAGDPAPPPARFRGVRSLVLLRELEQGAPPKDPLDGLEETLRARGFETRIVELGRDPPPEQAPLERLFRQLQGRATASRAERMSSPARALGSEAGETVARLGVDAVASYHRLERIGPAPLAPLTGMGTPAAPLPPPLPLGALVLVDRHGAVATFAWGDAGSLEEADLPLNAAEAIEQLVRALVGEPEE